MVNIFCDFYILPWNRAFRIGQYLSRLSRQFKHVLIADEEKMQVYTPLCLLLLAALVSAGGYEQDDEYDDAGGFYKYYGHVDRCSCSVYGNTYRAVNRCRSFTQSAAGIPATRQDCPKGLLFNTDVCVCDWPFRTYCRKGC